MKSLKVILQRRLLWLAAAIMILTLFVALFFQVMVTQSQARENADAAFIQVKQIIDESTVELEKIKTEYRETCILNAKAISYIIQIHPEILGNIEEFRQLAVKLEVNEIHIFDDTGRIFTGTHPEYFDYTFDSGEQIGFFKPLLEDKSLSLSQDITPNTAEGKLVQYSALWSDDGRYIIQVGMYPDAVLEVTEKSELSYVFSLLRGNPGVSMYAVNPKDGDIIGSTSGTENDKLISDIGIQLDSISRLEGGTHMTVNGVNSFCIFKNVNGTLLGYVISNDQLYSGITSYTILLVICLALIVAVMVFVVKKYTDKFIIHSISATNQCLRAVTEGRLDERVDVHTTLEFSELSSHINIMIRALIADTEKMNHVLNRTNLRIGVYEYNTKIKIVRFTEHIPEILSLSPDELAAMTSDYRNMKSYVDQIRRYPVPDAENTYRIEGDTEMYIKLEEITNDDTVLGIVMDVTEETVSRKRAEKERDIDPMTGLFNRRGMEHEFDRLFSAASKMGYGALIMIDMDDLKQINDTHGHAVGDIYLKQMAELLTGFSAPQKLAARIGGDEFVLLLYGYKHNNDVSRALIELQKLQTNTFVTVGDSIIFPLAFSYGYTLTGGRSDHENMLAVADEHMYNSKRTRKSST